MSQVKAIYRAGYTDYDGLDTYRVMPNRNVTIHDLEPFIFLNHHGPQEFPASNKGLPFGPHPHKGFETVTFVVDGDLVHQDSTGYRSNIHAGGIQWMTAGKGIIHSETSSDYFKEKGGNLEILQLWVNLPARLKSTPPAYTGLQKEQVKEISLDEGKVIVNLVAGSWGKVQAPIQSLSGIQLATIALKKAGSLSIDIPADHAVLFYVVRGSVEVNGEVADMHDLVEFDRLGGKAFVTAPEDALVIFGTGTPSNEPLVAQGPFVMNSQEEIRQAFVEYQEGKF